jgi:hypothetical protein
MQLLYKGCDILNKLLFILLLVLLSLTIIGCNLIDLNKEELPIEMIAFNSLTEEEKDLIPVSPKDSVVEKIKVTDDIARIIDNNSEIDKVYSVTFNHSETESSGNLIVFIDLDQKTIAGKMFDDKKE